MRVAFADHPLFVSLSETDFAEIWMDKGKEK